MTRVPYEYAVLRIVPRIEREEFVNVGVVLYCRDHDFLRAAVQVDGARLTALWADIDLDAIHAALSSVTDTCERDGSGPAAAEQIGPRFRWLTAPRSTVVQPGPVHTGLTEDPAAELDRLLARMVSGSPPQS